MKIKKILTTGILVAMTAVFMAGCGTSSATESNGKATTKNSSDAANTEDFKVVRIATPGIDSDGNAAMQEGAAIAQQKGFFEEELNAIGYTAEYIGFATQGVGVNEALAAEEADIALYGDFPAITYLAAGNEATIFGLNSTRVQVGIYAKDDIQSAADLKGKKVGTVLGTNAYKYLIDYLEENNLSVNDIEVVNATSDLASLFVSGDIDAIAQSPQLFYSMPEGAGHVLATNGDEENLACYYVALGRTAFLNENPGVDEAILKAIKKGQEYASAHKEEVYEILSGLSEYFTADIYKDFYSFNDSFEYWSPYLLDKNVTKIQDTADFMLQNQYIPAEVKISDHIKIVSQE